MDSARNNIDYLIRELKEEYPSMQSTKMEFDGRCLVILSIDFGSFDIDSLHKRFTKISSMVGDGYLVIVKDPKVGLIIDKKKITVECRDKTFWERNIQALSNLSDNLREKFPDVEVTCRLIGI